MTEPMPGLQDMDHPTQYKFIRILCMLRNYAPETDVSESVDLTEEDDLHSSGDDGFSDETNESD